MTNEEIIEKLYKIGKLPADSDEKSDNFPLEKFDELLQKFNTPVNENEALQLINLSPPVDTVCYGVEWALLHLIETVNAEKLQSVLDRSTENELRKLIQIRLDNYNKKHS